jgi:hypothetical protein
MNFRASIIPERPLDKDRKDFALMGGSQYVILVRGETNTAGLSAI